MFQHQALRNTDTPKAFGVSVGSWRDTTDTPKAFGVSMGSVESTAVTPKAFGVSVGVWESTIDAPKAFGVSVDPLNNKRYSRIQICTGPYLVTIR